MKQFHPADPNHIHDAVVPTERFHMPIVEVEAEKGWTTPGVGEVIRTHWEFFALYPKPAWRIGSYHTSEKVKHTGVSQYRSPSSLRAWFKVLPQLMSKVWKRMLQGLF